MFFGQRILSLLSRNTSGQPLIPEIDGLRFLALIPVVFYHIWGNFDIYAKGAFLTPEAINGPAGILCVDSGKMGVKLFFIISGFILGLPFARHHILKSNKISLNKYFKRRLVRLEPPYILNLTIIFIILLCLKPEFHFLDEVSHFLASVFYLHNIIYGEQSVINVVAWSLEIEVQFYILVPLLSLVFSIRSTFARRIFLILGILSATAISNYFSGLERFDLSIINFAQYFLVGFLLADLFVDTNGKDFARHYCYDLIMIVAVSGFFALGVVTPYHQLIAPWLGFLIVFSAFRGLLSNWFFTNPWVYTIGGMCYTIYLYHFLIIGFFGHGKLFIANSFWPSFIVTVTFLPLMILLISSIVFVLFERPFMRTDICKLSRQAT
ncbi:MAG: acyltransferase [Desulfuromonadaceae bacterium]|nr:acyltransferase [Desulfuromonadaceae bacterium]